MVREIDHSRRLSARLIVAAMVLLTYWPVLGHRLDGWDDWMNLRGNADFNPPTLRSIARYWKAPAFDLYAPLTFSAWGAIALFAYQPDAPREHQLLAWPFHAVNLLMHLAAALILLELLNRLIDSRRAGMLGALVFALHPLAVEPVAWASGLKDALAGTFGLAAILVYLHPARSMNSMALSCAMLLLALLSKASAVVVPAIALLLDLAARPRELTSCLRRSIPLFALVFPFLVVGKYAQQAIQIAPVPALDKPLIALDALGFYLVKLFWPFQLGADYGRTPELVLSRGWGSLLWVAPAVTLGVAVLAARRVSPKPLIAMAIFAVALAPMLGLVPFDFQAYSTVADHYAYLALAGPALAIAWLVARYDNRPVRTVMTIVCLLLAALSFRHTWTWRDTRSIAQQTLVANSRSWGAHLTLARLDLDENRLGDALDHAQRAAALHPQSPRTHVMLGQVHTAGRQFTQAIQAYEKALQLVPTDVAARVGLADALADSGQLQPAIDQYHRALEIAPRDVIALSNLASVHAQLGEFNRAIGYYEQALGIDPTFAPALAGRQRAVDQLRPPP
jgi:tetratricopeptide (TPR) repeat protein